MLRKERSNKGILLTDHLFRPVMGLSDECYVLTQGKTHLIKDPFDLETLGYSPSRK